MRVSGTLGMEGRSFSLAQRLPSVGGCVRTVAGAFVALTLLAVVPRDASASCVAMPDSCRYVAEADALFEATVSSVHVRQLPNSYLERVFRLEDVSEAWKGGAEDVVRSNRESGHGLEVGTRYIVDAVRDPSDGLLRVRPCSVTQPLEGAGGLLAAAI